eukprot:1142926-Pelagomonas_calceolata.AAC.1
MRSWFRCPCTAKGCSGKGDCFGTAKQRSRGLSCRGARKYSLQQQQQQQQHARARARTHTHIHTHARTHP